MTLKLRVILGVLGLFVAAMGALAAVAIHHLSTTLKAELSERQLGAISHVAAQIDEEVRRRLQALRQLATTLPPGWSERGTLADLDRLIHRTDILGNRLALVSAENLMLAASREWMADAPVVDSGFVSEVIGSGRPAVSAPLPGAKASAPRVLFAVPVGDGVQRGAGILLAAYSIEHRELFDLMDHARGESDGILVMSPKHGVFVTASDRSRWLQPIPAPGVNAMHDRYMSGYEGSGIAVNSRGIEELSSARRIPSTDWLAVWVSPTSKVFAPVAELRQTILVVALVLILLVAGLMLLFMRRQIAPLERLIARIDEAERAGRPFVELEAAGSQEIQQLATTFNRLQAHLQTHLETELEAARLDYATLVEEAPAGVFRAAPNGDIRFANRLCGEILGLSADQMAGSGWLSAIHPEDRIKIATLWHSEAKRRSLSLRVCGNGDELRWVGLHVVPIGGKNPGFIGSLIDISERKRIEAERREAHLLTMSMLENSLVGIVYLKERVVIACNHRFEELFGYAPGELLGQRTEVLFPSPQEFQQVGDIAYAHLANGKPYSHELAMRRKDGSAFWCWVNGKAIDARHPADGSIWIYEDVSEYKAQQDEVHKLLRAIEQSPVSIVITNREAQIEYVNPAFCAITGYSRHEVIGQNPRLLQSGETPLAVYQELWQTLLSGREWRGTLKNRRKDGSVFWEEAVIGAVTDPTGEITHFIAVKEDITARRAAEQALVSSETRYRLLFQHMVGGCALADITRDAAGQPDRYTMIDANNIFLAMFGVPVGSRFGKQARKRYHQWFSHLDVVASSGKQAHFEVFVALRQKYFEVRAFLPAPDQIAVICHDVTERHRAELAMTVHHELLRKAVEEKTADLAVALEDAHAAERTKDQFLANMSHEMRTPLNGILGMVGLAMRTPLSGKQQAYLNNIHQAGEQLLALVNDVLDLSKIVAGKMPLDHTDFGLDECIGKVFALLAPRAREKNLDVQWRIDEEVPGALRGDPRRLAQVLTNLLGNAIKFTDVGKIHLQVGAKPLESGQWQVVFSMSDSGIGIAPAALDKLFLPFSQVDDSMTRRHGGTGLGLAICKSLVAAMDGSIRVHSVLGEGSTFTFDIRCKAAGLQYPGATPNELSHRWQASSHWRFDETRVLVVDDQAMNRQVASELLEVAGISVDTADNGAEALEQLLKTAPEPYDAVLMDVQMPVMDGLTATQRLRAIPGFEGLPIIAMTAHAAEKDKQQCLAVGMNTHIAKPFDPAELLDVLATLVAQHKRHRIAPTSAAVPAGAVAGAHPVQDIAWQEALPRFGGSLEKYAKWLNDFAANQADAVDFLQAALAQGDRRGAAKRSHLIKGQAGTLGIVGLQAAASRLESALQANHPGTAELDEFARTMGESLGMIADLLARLAKEQS